MYRVVPDEEVRNFEVQSSSAEPVLEDLGSSIGNDHREDMLQISSFGKAMLTLRSFSRNSWTGAELLHSQRMWSQFWKTLPDGHTSFRECWAPGALRHVSQ